MSDRPYLPTDSSIFDLRSMHPTAAPLNEEFSRAALREALTRSGTPAAEISAAITAFDDPGVRELVSDPTLRAGLLLLRRGERWAPFSRQ